MLKIFIIWPSPAIIEKFAREFQDVHQILYVVGRSMVPIYPSLHPNCMLLIITTANGFIQSCCRASYPTNICFGIFTQVGRDRYMMPTCE